MCESSGNPTGTVGDDSKLMIAFTVCVLFAAFFQTDHDLNFTVSRLSFDLSHESITGITVGNVANRVAYVGLFAWSLVLLLVRRRNPIPGFDGVLGWLLLGYGGWVGVSLLWADDTTLVGRRVVVFSILMAAGAAMSLAFSIRTWPVVILSVTSMFLVVGFYCERTLGTWWFRTEGYRFSGTCHPNAQANNCAMLFLAAAAMGRPRHPLTWVLTRGVMAVSLIFLLLTRSRGPFLALILAYLVFVVLTRNPARFVANVYVGVALICVAVVILGDLLLPALSTGILLGRIEEQLANLNGRVELWADTLQHLKEHPFRGYGYNGFWSEDRVHSFTEVHGWMVDSSHSMWLETALGVGLIGLALFLATLVLAWWKSVRRCLNGASEFAFPSALLTLWVADGMLSTLTVGRGFVNFLLFVVLFSVAWRTVGSTEDAGRE